MGSLFSPALAFAVAALTAVCGLLLLVAASRRQPSQEPATGGQSPAGASQAHTQQTTPSRSDPVTEPIPVPLQNSYFLLELMF